MVKSLKAIVAEHPDNTDTKTAGAVFVVIAQTNVSIAAKTIAMRTGGISVYVGTYRPTPTPIRRAPNKKKPCFQTLFMYSPPTCFLLQIERVGAYNIPTHLPVI